ncbi:RHS repeat domain-containing protein [Pararcticibacter amylolyticus]|uniref:Sugar-binding protein n=1 Tax=Pararcticibacter amylolyticus TaxID=2173175 RepID=A0A2U2PJM8_9SPHI|nr:RHS repeat domain-containing protein [Pararcticibacter amylolyticus]PWG81601.1 hypothetical protein DDR33_07155 [Pararcticibacter amylolyticus]
MNKQLSLILAGIASCLIMAGRVSAQIPLAPANVQSPNAASLGMFGEIPVSYYTGIPSIEVPLYTLQQKGISVPLTLNYHASGFRPDMHPGWVGTGFALSCGGVVSRVIKDAPDDYSNGNYYLGANMGYYYNHNVLNTSSWNQTGYMQNIARGNEMLKDTEPDEFNFNFGGYAGSFYMHADGTWRVKCDKPLKVSLYGSFLNIPFTAPYGTRMQNYGMSQSFGGFVITTEDGTKYYFGGNTNAIEYSIGFFNQDVDEWLAGSWYLTKIAPPVGDEINFSYERDDYVNQMYIAIVNDLGTRTKNSGGIFNPQPACSSWSYSQVYHNYNGKLVAPVYLRQITGLHNVIKFNRSTSTELRYDPVVYEYRYSQWSMYGGGYYGTDFIPVLADNGTSYYPQYLDKLQWKKLDQIRVEKTDGALVKAFNFTYNNVSYERLRLLSVNEIGADLNPLPPYTFSYDQSASLPGYLSNMVDHWGFYNGTYADMSNQNTYYTTYYNYREPVATYLYAGTLNKITYPTGGVTEFTYEPNTYSKRLQEVRGNGIDYNFSAQNKLAGGLRIKKISSYDPRSPLQKQEKFYYYVSNYSNTVDPNTLNSSGVLGGQIKYYFEDYSRRAFNDNGITYSKSLFSSQSVLPGCINAMGSHIGYSEVTEKLSDGSYTRYLFTNFDTGNGDQSADNVLQLSRTAYEPYSSAEEERGKLLTEYSYTAAGQFSRIRSIYYSALNKAGEYVPALKANYANVCPNTAVSVEEGTAYRLYTYSYLPVSETISEYNQGSFVTSTSKLTNYNTAYRLPADETITDSKGRSVKTAYVYPYDLPSSQPYSAMLQANRLVPAVQHKTYVDGAQTSATITGYIQLGNGFVPSSITTYTNSASSPHTIALADYDNKGNPVWVRKNSWDMGAFYIWGYGGQYLLAKVENVDYMTALSAIGGTSATNAFRDIVNPSQAQVNSFLAPLYALPTAQVSAYSYDPSKGLISSKDARGLATSYDYDNNQRLLGVRDFNGDIIKGLEYYYRQP